jgi:predicted regulator of Ras-like GTPase activity (Roadblock/LC7/MglB family)
MNSPYRSNNGDLATAAAPGLSSEAQTFNWLLDSFRSGTAGVVEAVAVSADGLLMAKSAAADHANADRLAAVISGMTSLAAGVADTYQLGGLNKVIVDMAGGFLLATAISRGSVLGVIADRSANLGTVAYEMTLFASRAGAVLTPQLIIELKNAVQS